MKEDAFKGPYSQCLFLQQFKGINLSSELAFHNCNIYFYRVHQVQMDQEEGRAQRDQQWVMF